MDRSFEDLYENLKSTNSEKLNTLWLDVKKERKKRNIIFLIVACLVNGLILYYLSSLFHFASGVSTIILLSSILIFNLFIYVIINVIFCKEETAYKYAFKEIIIEQLLNNFYDNLDYIPKKLMPESIYMEAKYKEYHNRYYSDDYMEGYIRNTNCPIKMAEVHTVHETTSTDSDGHTHTSRTTKFHGLFAKINMNKSISSELLIRANHAIPVKTKLEMDSQEFEKYFDVSASNPIIGMQLLTHDIMELLISFKKTTGITYDISIYNNIMYLRFHTGAMFEIKSIKKGALDKDMLRNYYNVLDFTYNLSKTLIDLVQNAEI